MKRMIVARGGKRGKTAGRGGKGQSARAGNKRRPEWRDIIKKLPKLRGRGKSSHKPVSDAFVVVNLSRIESIFAANDIVTPATLIQKGVISTLSGKTPAIKILGDGEVTKAFKVSGCAVSGSAKEKIEKAGGTIVVIPSRILVKPLSEAQVAKAAMPKREKAPKVASEVKAVKVKGGERKAVRAESSKVKEVKSEKVEKPKKIEKVAEKKSKSK